MEGDGRKGPWSPSGTEVERSYREGEKCLQAGVSHSNNTHMYLIFLGLKVTDFRKIKGK